MIFAFLVGTVIAYGSTPALYDLQIANIERTIDATVYAYTASVNETDSTPFITASGARVREGIVANNCLPFGTLVVIDGRMYEVQDRMNARYGCSYFDVFMESKREARAFGKQYHEVIILGSTYIV